MPACIKIKRMQEICSISIIMLTITINSTECHALAVEKLRLAYPNFISKIDKTTLTWFDGSKLPLNRARNNLPTLQDQLLQPIYPHNNDIPCITSIPSNDPGRTRNEDFFEKMYGDTELKVKNNLTTVYWMPGLFGNQYALKISHVNKVDLHLKNVSQQLEKLVMVHPEFKQYLDNPSGSFYWRHIENSGRRSPHSYGIAIDLNTLNSNYWIWDTKIKNNSLKQTDSFEYKNRIPCEIVTIFENNGFIWGGKWKHYDTMHFEYRPELIQ